MQHADAHKQLLTVHVQSSGRRVLIQRESKREILLREEKDEEGLKHTTVQHAADDFFFLFLEMLNYYICPIKCNIHICLDTLCTCCSRKSIPAC